MVKKTGTDVVVERLRNNLRCRADYVQVVRVIEQLRILEQASDIPPTVAHVLAGELNEFLGKLEYMTKDFDFTGTIREVVSDLQQR